MDSRRDDEPVKRRAVVEILDRDGHARQVVPVWHWPITIGRAIECDVVLDDPHVAGRHATLWEGDVALDLQVGDSLNGVRLRNRRLTAGERGELAPGEVFQLGGTRVRVRRASDPLALERALAVDTSGSRRSLFALVLALLAWSVAEQWLNTDPGGRMTDYLPVLIGSPAMLAVWCGIWALGSKLFHHRFEFLPHVRIAVTCLLVLGVLGLALPLIAYSLSWAFPSRIVGLVGGAVLCAMILQHLTLILPSYRRGLAIAMGAIFVAGALVLLVRNYQVNDRVFAELYVSTLAPPALRLAPTVPTARFLDESRQMKAVLDAHAKDDTGQAEPWVEE